jgi:hypothetical protein
MTRSKVAAGILVTVRLIREIVVRWHQGNLIFEGTRRGAVFTVTLPPFSG